MEKFETYSDEQLISMMRDGQPGVMDFLMDKYKNLVRKRANALYLIGGETEDLIQEGMIGLFKAINDYEIGESSFFNFADLCVNRQLYRAIESANRKKHGPLNKAVSLSVESEETQVSYEGAINSADAKSPEQIVIERENMQQFLTEIYSLLSKMEKQVLELYLDGMNYQQIAAKLEKTPKSVDNALQRIRSKINTKN